MKYIILLLLCGCDFFDCSKQPCREGLKAMWSPDHVCFCAELPLNNPQNIQVGIH